MNEQTQARNSGKASQQDVLDRHDHPHGIDRNDSPEHDMNEVAIIGMAGRFPGAENLAAFWSNLCNGVESLSGFNDHDVLAAVVDSEILVKPNYVKAGGVLADIDQFDAAFFGYSPAEARVMDPQLRFFMECAWEALENAGYVPETASGSVGVFAGTYMSQYLLLNIYAGTGMGGNGLGNDLFTLIVNDKDYLTTHVSYKLNLTGPSICVQTACSTSLVAVHLASQSLLNGECDMALAGGVTIRLPQEQGYLYQEGSILSPDGHCRAFDARAQGTVPGNGVGIVVLKRLREAIEDGDHIYAVIKGSAVNNDGSLKVGYVAPSVDGQVSVIREALTLAECDPDDITYVETHGTGTSIGDPIEITALTRAFGGKYGATKTCGIGSVKTNVGHLAMAAGVTGVIKTALALKHRQLPPSLHFESPNPEIDFDHSPFYVNTHLKDWHTDGRPRRAGISSFGIGGTNAHVVLEEPPEWRAAASVRSQQLLVLSARSEAALDAQTRNLVAYFAQHPDLPLADVAYTLHLGRRHFHHRRTMVCRDVQDAVEVLTRRAPYRLLTSVVQPRQRSVVFMFPGQGVQYLGMGQELYRLEAVFRKQIDRCSERLYTTLGFDLRTLLVSPVDPEAAAQKLRQTAYIQPALFVIEYALAKLLMAWGILPEAMLGHSLGEYVAACLAGVMAPEDALELVTIRGHLMQAQPQGTMLAVSLSEKETLDHLGEQLSLAAINGPAACVIAGPDSAITQFETRLRVEGVACHVLHTSHAFHSSMMEPMVDRFRDEVRKIALRPPQIPFISNLTGTWITPAQATDPNYWARHVREPVRFAAGIVELLKDVSRICLEVGPGRTLATLCQSQTDTSRMRHLPCLPHAQENASESAFLLETLGKLYLMGVAVDWSGFYAGERRCRVALPTYPFERHRYWVEPRKAVPAQGASQGPQSREIRSRNLIIRSDQDNAKVNLGKKPSGPRVESPAIMHDRPPLGYEYIAPRNKTEQIIATIWQEFLGIKQVGVYDSFFELGGSSLRTIEMQQKLQDIFRMDVPLQTIMENQTVADLAIALMQLNDGHAAASISRAVEPFSNQRQDAGPEPPWGRAKPPIIPLKTHGTKAPFFCVHALLGMVFPYYKLSMLLDVDRPIYAIQSFGPGGALNPYRTIEAIAAYYLENLREIQPQGPYYLGGWSYGSLIAYEMARQLTGIGQVVNVVALLDTPAPRSARLTENLYMAYETVRDSWPLVRDYWALLRQASRRNLPLGRRSISTDANQGKLVPSVRPLLRASWVNSMATMKYRPKPYSGRVTLFRTNWSCGKQQQKPDWGWGRLAAGGVEVLSISGSHMSLLHQPYVESVACQLQYCLDRFLD